MGPMGKAFLLSRLAETETYYNNTANGDEYALFFNQA